MGKILQGPLGLSPAFVHSTPLSWQPPKDVATLSLKVLKDSESAARPVGRYLLHAKAVVCLVLPQPQLFGVFALCGILSPPTRVSSLGQKKCPR